jgi:hypothetical protein
MTNIKEAKNKQSNNIKEVKEFQDNQRQQLDNTTTISTFSESTNNLNE